MFFIASLIIPIERLAYEGRTVTFCLISEKPYRVSLTGELNTGKPNANESQSCWPLTMSSPHITYTVEGTQHLRYDAEPVVSI